MIAFGRPGVSRANAGQRRRRACSLEPEGLDFVTPSAVDYAWVVGRSPSGGHGLHMRLAALYIDFRDIPLHPGHPFHMDASSRERERSPLLIPAAVLALGILLAATIFGAFFYNSRAQTSTIQVVGSATERFTSDVAKWRLSIARQVGDIELAAGYAQLRDDLEDLTARLQAAGIDSADINIQPVNANPMWSREGERSGYNVTQSLFILSENPTIIEQLALNPGELLESGVLLEGSYIEYYYSKIADLKHSLLARATEDARARAEEIAGGEAGREVGAMMSGRAGVFQITEPYSTDVSAGGMYSTSTKVKEISVTVHATFEAD